MLLVYGTAGMGLAMLVFGIVLIGSRNPQEPVWAKEFLVANIYVPAIVAIALLSMACFVQFILSIGSQLLGVKEFALEIGIVAMSIVLLKLLRVKQHLTEYGNKDKSAEIIKPAEFFKTDVESNKPEPPAKPTSTEKAA